MPDAKSLQLQVTIAWTLSFALGCASSVIQAATGVPGSGKWAVYAGLVVAALFFLLVRRDPRGLNLAIAMSLSSLLLGGALGLLVVPLFSDTPPRWRSGLTWSSIGAAFSAWFALILKEVLATGLRTSRELFGAAEDPHRALSEFYHALRKGEESPEQLAARLNRAIEDTNASLAELRRESRRSMIFGGILMLTGFILLATVSLEFWSRTWWWAVPAILFAVIIAFFVGWVIADRKFQSRFGPEERLFRSGAPRDESREAGNTDPDSE